MFFKNFIKEYLTFSRTEKRGIIFLLFVICGLIAFQFILNFTSVEEKTDFSGFENDVKRFEAMLKKDSIDNAQKQLAEKIDSVKTIPENTKKEISFFNFDPNTLPDSLWMQFGLSEKQAAVISNYRNKGGKFFSKDDVKKMFVIKEDLYKKLEPYIQIPEKKFVAEKNWKEKTTDSTKIIFPKKTKENILIDINNSSSDDFEKLPGIGPGRAQSIISYRINLGGFVAKEQIKEVFGMTDSLYLSIENNLTYNNIEPLKININNENISELKHPYLNYKTAKLIVNYHKMHGDFKSVDELKKLDLVNAELYRKLAPYLKVGNK